VHAGIYKGAKVILGHVRDKLVELRIEFPGWQLTITGHSLGAGTACMLGLLLLTEPDLYCDFHVYAFAPP
jgi:hypothetical protein